MRWGFWPSTVDSPVCCVLCIPLHHLLFLSAFPLKTAHCSAQLFLLYMEVYTISENKGGAQLEPYRRKTRIHIYRAVCVCVYSIHMCVCVCACRAPGRFYKGKSCRRCAASENGRTSQRQQVSPTPTSSRNHLSTIFQIRSAGNKNCQFVLFWLLAQITGEFYFSRKMT